MKFFQSILFFAVLVFSTSLFAQKIGVVDVQKVFDGYQKVKEARERLDKSKQVAMEELEIFRDEMEKIVNELKEMEEKLKNPNIDTSTLKEKYQEKVKVAKEKQDDMVAYDKRAKATIAQRQRNLLVEHLEDIRAAIKKVSLAKGLDLVLNSSETQLGVFYSSDNTDYTEEVIVTLNAENK
jgi:outer membrane protein